MNEAVIFNIILLILGIVILFKACFKYKELEQSRVDCRVSLQKDIGIMILSMILYVALEINWITESYVEIIDPIDEYGWSCQELLVEIVFLRILSKMTSCKHEMNERNEK